MLFDPDLTFGLFRALFGLQIAFRIRAGLEPELVGVFTILNEPACCAKTINSHGPNILIFSQSILLCYSLPKYSILIMD